MNQTPQPHPDIRKTYEKPLIVHEIELETRAGSPVPPLPPFLLPK